MSLPLYPAPPPPCAFCTAACCKARPGMANMAVELRPDEVADFPEAIDYRLPIDGVVKALPYVNGRCIHLGDDDRCQIYDRRPLGCREFNCVHRYRQEGFRNGYFLRVAPEVAALIEAVLPEWTAAKREEWRQIEERRNKKESEWSPQQKAVFDGLFGNP